MSTSRQVADALGDRIYRCELLPGAPLREIPIAEEFQVSRRTVREALLVLVSQGLVDHVRNHGASVRVLRAEDVVDLYRVRRTLEVQGARACTDAEDGLRARLTSALEALATAAHADDAQDIILRDLAFHGAVVGLTGSPRLDAFYSRFSHEMRMALTMIRQDEMATRTTPDQVVADHRRIHDHLLARDAFGAQLAIVEHIAANERRLLSLIG
ncbi:GntR family transcriptional regulator [Streptomyces rugosispiralis]|uniref:GntR family transcriptional regulator n=1 Tax=Streptomyces rugosispiralis TaxID=2967341 RepID=A0ABT1UPI0_9ACTN|nr:GntR family transcriptional regulator [Streptomyces rugosispiralis]MCQ8186937.1 GntR family transcriptional regulator [Streptomyces rugosispiralis]